MNTGPNSPQAVAYLFIAIAVLAMMYFIWLQSAKLRQKIRDKRSDRIIFQTVKEGQRDFH